MESIILTAMVSAWRSRLVDRIATLKCTNVRLGEVEQALRHARTLDVAVRALEANARALDLRVRIVKGDAGALLTRLGQFDVVFSAPPYEADIPKLTAQILASGVLMLLSGGAAGLLWRFEIRSGPGFVDRLIDRQLVSPLLYLAKGKARTALKV